MLFPRRKRATAVEPVTPEAGRAEGASPGSTNGDQVPARPPAPDPVSTTVVSASGAPTVPLAAPSHPDQSAGPGPAPAPDEESGDSDLDRFFAALRKVVHDAREKVAADPVESTMSAHAAPAAQPSRLPGESSASTSVGALVPVPPDPVPAPVASTTELAPSTTELVASLEADRDLWRERAVVWRERAMGADLLVKALNSHMSDLQVNLEDLRLAMRVLGDERTDAELPAATSHWNGPERYLESGA